MISRSNYRNKSKILILIIVLTLLITSCFITLLIDFNKNIGIIPLMFILFFIYSIINILNRLYYEYDPNSVNKKSIISKTQVLFAIISVVMFIISYIVLWM